MENIEKVDRLRERADVSYEEAKAALEAANWDLLDAMVALEKAGKTAGPAKTNFSTSYEQQENYVKVQEKVEKQRKESAHVGRSLRDTIRNFFRVCVDNSFCVTRHDEEIFRLPIIVLVIAVLAAWKWTLLIMVVALFFGCRYHFEGRDQLDKANQFMDSAGKMAESMKEGFFEKDNEQKNEQNHEQNHEQL